MVLPHRLRRNFNKLKLLKKAKKSQRRKLLEAADNDLILCLCDCANNILKGNVNLNPKQKKQLARHKGAIRSLVSRGKSKKTINKKRKLLIQQGGFLPMLLGPILSVASGLLSNFLGPRQ